MERINTNIICTENNCNNVTIEGKCYLDPKFVCFYKLENKIHELISNETISIEYRDMIPVNKLYELLEEL